MLVLKTSAQLGAEDKKLFNEKGDTLESPRDVSQDHGSGIDILGKEQQDAA